MTKTATPPIKVARHFEVFIEDQVSSGQFQTPTAVVEAALRLLEEREAALAELGAAIAVGDASGPSRPYDRTAFLAARRREAGE